METEGLRVEDHSCLHNEFEANQGYIITHLNKQKKQTKKKYVNIKPKSRRYTYIIYVILYIYKYYNIFICVNNNILWELSWFQRSYAEWFLF